MYKVKHKRKRNYAGPSGNNGKKFNRPGKIDINKYIEKNRTSRPAPPYVNEHGFSDFQIPRELVAQISNRGYTAPTEIQDKTIPHILTGRDLIGIAGTGTGKTAAFLIPIIQKLMDRPQHNNALIVAPTRELATQIFEEFRALTKGLKLYATCLIGGLSVSRSVSDLRKDNHVIIGTPGRLIDMVKRGALPLEQFKTLVLDEFDRMLDMGFLKDVQYLNGKMTAKNQTLLFSATMDASQKAIVQGMTNAPIEVTAGVGTDRTHAIEQDVVYVPRDGNKLIVLQELLSNKDGEKVLLFCETKRLVNKVHKNLRNANIRVDMIHGDKTQRARETALNKFRNGRINVLVATDVVARGIDVTDVTMVINYEVPRNYNDYVHRIGRTGRAGKSGKAITLID